VAGQIQPTPDAHHGTEVDVHHGAEVVRYDPDAPSADWGWHGDWREFAPRGSRILLWLGVFGLLSLLWGNHISRVEEWWLLAIAALMAGWLVHGEYVIRRRRRRRP